MMGTSAIGEYSQAEAPARSLLERIGWKYLPQKLLAAERTNEREVLLKDRLRAALLRLNEWMTDEQANRVIFDLQNIDATGMGRNELTPRVPHVWYAAGLG